MVELISPNGVRFSASDADAPLLLEHGYTRADEQKPEPKRRAPRKAPKPDQK